MSQVLEGPPLPLISTPAATDPAPTPNPEPYEVPDEYKIVDATDEAKLKRMFPEIGYICGQPPERCSGANYIFERKDKRVFRMVLSKLVRKEEEWMGPDAPLPKIDYRYVTQFFRALRDQNCSGQEVENEVASKHSEASNSSSSAQGNDDGNTPADTCKSGDIDEDVKETLKLYKGTYNESGYNGFGRRYETMSTFINYIVIDYLGDLKTHVEKNTFVVLKRFIVYDLTKNNIDY
ncbi:hypothetical protein H4S07_006305, partial [Coemansia furcata]